MNKRTPSDIERSVHNGPGESALVVSEETSLRIRTATLWPKAQEGWQRLPRTSGASQATGTDQEPANLSGETRPENRRNGKQGVCWKQQSSSAKGEIPEEQNTHEGQA